MIAQFFTARRKIHSLGFVREFNPRDTRTHALAHLGRRISEFVVDRTNERA